jgi:hypothetical protein
MRGFFAALRMTPGWRGDGEVNVVWFFKDSNGKSKNNSKSKNKCGVLPRSTSLRVRMTPGSGGEDGS